MLLPLKVAFVSMSHMNEALWNWNKERGRTIISRNPTVRHTATDYLNRNASHDDGRSYVYRESDPAGYVAVNRKVCKYTVDGYYAITESDINNDAKFANGAVSNCTDFWYVFMHEAGYTIGLGDIYDSYYSDSIMFATGASKKNSTNHRWLRQDDINGAKWINYYYY